MKLSAAQINSFLSKPPASVRAFLVYGPDSGLVRERLDQLTAHYAPNKNDPFCVTVLTGAQVKADPSLLLDEASSLPLGGGRRLVLLQQSVDPNATALSAFLESPPAMDSVILIEGGDLDKRSKLRALCEGASDLVAAIPCYVEDAAARLRTIEAFLAQEKLKAPRDVLRFLESSLPPDRMALRSEINKLALYAMGKNEITLEDVRAVIADAAGAEIDDLVQAVAGGDPKRATALIDHLTAEQTPAVSLLRGLQRHLMRLQLARAYMAQGLDAESAIKKLSPPVFWKNVAPMTKQLTRWPLERIEARLAQLAQTEAAVKQTGMPADALCSQLFLSIAVKA